jgi:hypothetical protein
MPGYARTFFAFCLNLLISHLIPLYIHLYSIHMTNLFSLSLGVIITSTRNKFIFYQHRIIKSTMSKGTLWLRLQNLISKKGSKKSALTTYTNADAHINCMYNVYIVLCYSECDVRIEKKDAITITYIYLFIFAN